MIIGIGNDICNQDRIKAAFERHGERFVAKILTPAEQAACHARRDPVTYLTMRFAAKEAIYKAIAQHITPNPSWQDAEILNDEEGRPIVTLSNRCQTRLDEVADAPVRLLLSLSDEAPFAFATCIATSA